MTPMEQEGFIPEYEDVGRYEPTDRAWLIERRSGGIPEWLYVHNEFFQWTRESLLAIRFCRREDAEQVAAVIGEDAEYVTEHQWGP